MNFDSFRGQHAGFLFRMKVGYHCVTSLVFSGLGHFKEILIFHEIIYNLLYFCWYEGVCDLAYSIFGEIYFWPRVP